MTVTHAVPVSTTRDVGAPRLRRRSAAWLGLTPFALYVLLFLAVPALVAIGSGFFDKAGSFTFGNLAAFANPHILNNFFNSFWVSALTAIVGAILGAVVCFAMLGAKPDGALRSVVDSASSVLAQFGGLMLAFAFIATIGIQGALTQALVALGFTQNVFNDFHGQPLLYSVPGLVIPYLYFQIPLMVLTFMPAMEGLKATWGEANATLGGTRFVYWTRIAFPILAPAFFGSVILLFANSFSSYATAAALIDQGGIVPLAIKQQSSSETIVGTANVAGVLALGMVIIMVVLMTAYSAPAAARIEVAAMSTVRVGAMPSTTASRTILIVTGVLFVVPILAMILFSLRVVGSKTALTFDHYVAVVTPANELTYDGLFQGIVNSLAICAITVLIVLVLLLPTMLLVELRYPKLRSALEFICIIPITIPSIVLVVGFVPVYRVVSGIFGSYPWTLAFAIGIIVLPYAFRPIAANLAGVEVGVLSEAGRSLGANWASVLWRVILPNLRRGILSACFITIAVVLGEFTIASFLSQNTFQTALLLLQQTDPYVAVIFAVLALVFAFLILLLIGRLARNRKSS